MVNAVERGTALLRKGLRSVVGKTEAGQPHFTPEERQNILQEGRNFVREVRTANPDAGVDVALFREWMPKQDDFARPLNMAANIHTHHNMRHVGAVLAEEMFLKPYVEKTYSLPRPLMANAVYASAAGHDLLRARDIWGSVPDSMYKVHGKRIAQEIREGKRFPQLTPEERVVAATSTEFHDVDPRKPSDRTPEDELLAIVDRGELVRLMYGVGPVAKMARKLKTNPFEKRMNEYESHYFPGLMEKILPLSKSMLILSIDGLRKGLSQEDALIYAMQELGMVKEKASVASETPDLATV